MASTASEDTAATVAASRKKSPFALRPLWPHKSDGVHLKELNETNMGMFLD